MRHSLRALPPPTAAAGTQTKTARVRATLRALGGVAVLLAAGCLLPTAASADDFPNKRITLIVPYAPGGQGDFIGRLVSQRLSERIGQPVVIEHRPSVTGNVGVVAGSKAPPDGYTLTLISKQNLVSNIIEGQGAFNIVRDLVPVSKLAEYQLMLLVKPSLPVNNVQELLALMKAKPGSVTLGSGGVGSSGHVAMGLISQKTGVQILHVPYKGDGPMLNAILGGEVDMAFVTVSGGAPLLKAGKLRALAVASPKRQQAFPDVPTVGETIPGFEFTAWFGVAAPVGTPRDRVEYLSKEIAAVLQMPEIKQPLAERAFEVDGGTPEKFSRDMRAESEVLTRLIKELGIKPE